MRLDFDSCFQLMVLVGERVCPCCGMMYFQLRLLSSSPFHIDVQLVMLSNGLAYQLSKLNCNIGLVRL